MGDARIHSDRWDSILQQAAEVFYRKGYHGASIEDVARAVGMLKGSLYYHIRSKEDLLVSLIRQTLEQLGAEVAARAADRQGPLERLRGMLEAHVDFALREPTRMGVLLNEHERLRGTRRQQVQQMLRAYERRFARVVRQAQQAGQVIDGPAELIAQSLLGLGGWVVARLAPVRQRAGVQQLRQTLLRMMLEGVVR